MNNGWIKLHRKIVDCGFFNNPELSHFWVWCLCKASHRNVKTSIKYKCVCLNPGQFIFGRHMASIETGLSERTIRTCVRHLEKLGNVTIKATKAFSIITICNWDGYQSVDNSNDQQNDQQVTNRRPTSDHIQECKEQKNDKKKEIGDEKEVSSPRVKTEAELLKEQVLGDERWG